MVPVAIAKTWNQVLASTLQDCAGSVADAACVQGTYAVVHVVTYAIPIVVGFARPSAHVEGVQLVSVAVAVGGGNVSATTFVNVAGAVADAAGVQSPNALVEVVANPVSIDVGVTCTPTNAQGIDLVAVAIAVAFWQVVTTAVVHHAWTVAHPTRVQCTHTTVHVVANAVGIEVFRATAATFTHGVRLVPVAIAVAQRDNGASARVNGAGSVADPACVQGADARVFVVADAVKVHVEVAPAAAHPNGVFLASEAIAFAFLDVVAATLVHWARTVAHPARVQGSDAVVFVVA